MKINYNSNNSGGSWWLKDEDWYALEKAGWDVEWKKDELDITGKPYKDGRWLGGLARSASKDFATIKEALEEFEKITGQKVTDEGCNCCGAPHEFSWDDENGEHQYAYGNDCLQYLFPDEDIPKNLREAIDH